jgi:hypothetical protein
MKSCRCGFFAPLKGTNDFVSKKIMKKLITNLTALSGAFLMMWSCSIEEIPVIDSPPSIRLGAITSGLVENQDFNIVVTLNDGADNGSISTLESFSYQILKGSESVASGSEVLTGDNQVITIAIAGGFEPGQYNLDVKATDSNGNESTDNLSFTVSSTRPDFDISGTWTIEPVAGALKVGPNPGSGEWFQTSAGDVAVRNCFFDDTYTFGTDGKFSYDMGGQTWLETWQGVAADGCGVPVAPFDGAGSYTYTYTTTTLTLIGQGAHVGLSKVNNAGEISNGVPVANQIAYTIADQSKDGDVRRMTLRIEAGSGVWWDFKLISGTPPAAPLAGTWKMEPVEAAFHVGPSAGSREWFFNTAADVATRACFFDDTYTFGEDGSFSISMGDQTWLEAWQGIAADGCGAPAAPHNGAGTYTYQFDGTTLKLIGQGAHVGLPKAVNAGELPNVTVPDDVTYKVASLTESGGVRKMTLHIETGTGVWWTFNLISE